LAQRQYLHRNTSLLTGQTYARKCPFCLPFFISGITYPHIGQHPHTPIFVAQGLPRTGDNMRKRLTDKSIAALRRKASRYEVQDEIAPGLAVRASERGTKSFIMIARFPGSDNPVRRTLGEYGALTLEHARDMTREWHALIKRGVDPAHEMERQRRDAARKRSSTFAAVVEDYLAVKRPDQRRAREAERPSRHHLLPVLGDRPIGEITAADIAGLIKTIRKRSQYGARNSLIYASSIFKWALSQHCYPLIANPAAGLERENLIGKLKPRARLLSEVELFA